GAFIGSTRDPQDGPQQHAEQQSIGQNREAPAPDRAPGAETRYAQPGASGPGSTAEGRPRHEDRRDVVASARLIGGLHQVARDLGGVSGVTFRNLANPAGGQVIDDYVAA